LGVLLNFLNNQGLSNTIIIIELKKKMPFNSFLEKEKNDCIDFFELCIFLKL
jgi:hypothetical protein